MAHYPAVSPADEEGDLVTVATTADLEEAVRHFPEGLMLWVFQPDHPAAAAILHTGPQVSLVSSSFPAPDLIFVSLNIYCPFYQHRPERVCPCGGLEGTKVDQ